MLKITGNNAKYYYLLVLMPVVTVRMFTNLNSPTAVALADG